MVPLTSSDTISPRMKFASCSMEVTSGTRTHKYLFVHGGYCSTD